MADGYTQLNVGVGGSIMDEEEVTFSSGPTTRKRPRVVMAGQNPGEIAKVANSTPSSNDYGVVTRNIPSGTQDVSIHVPGTSIVHFGNVTGVTANSETVIATYTVPTSKTLNVTGFIASGDIHARFKLYINGSAIASLRSAVTNPTVIADFQMATSAATQSQVVEVRVTHWASGLNGEFDATILGYLV